MKPDNHKLLSAVFITFSGNCRRALSFYQRCFGGFLQFELLDEELKGFMEIPVVSGSLVSESIIIHGSDLVPEEGRRLGNYIAVFLPFGNAIDRKIVLEKLDPEKYPVEGAEDDRKLIEVTDAFDVRWVLGI